MKRHPCVAFLPFRGSDRQTEIRALPPKTETQRRGYNLDCLIHVIQVLYLLLCLTIALLLIIRGPLAEAGARVDERLNTSRRKRGLRRRRRRCLTLRTGARHGGYSLLILLHL